MNKMLNTHFNYASFIKLAAEFRGKKTTKYAKQNKKSKKCKNDLTIVGNVNKLAINQCTKPDRVQSIVLLSIGSAGELMELLLLLLRLLFIYFALRVKSTTYIMSWPKLKLHFRQVHTRASTETGLPSSIEKWHITYVIWAVRYRECAGRGCD